MRSKIIADFILVILLLSASLSLFSATVYMIIDGNSSFNWFTRLSLGLICLGLASINLRLRK